MLVFWINDSELVFELLSIEPFPWRKVWLCILLEAWWIESSVMPQLLGWVSSQSVIFLFSLKIKFFYFYFLFRVTFQHRNLWNKCIKTVSQRLDLWVYLWYFIAVNFSFSLSNCQNHDQMLRSQWCHEILRDTWHDWFTTLPSKPISKP